MMRAWHFTLHVVLLTLFSYFAFSHVEGRLFIGNDGPMLVALAKQQIKWFGFTTSLHTNFLQGIGNISFPINLAAIPGHWLPVFDAEGNFAPAATYTFFAVLMFVTVLLVGWNYHFDRGTSLAAAWLLTILMFPYFENYFRIYAVTASSPVFVWYMFAAAVGDVGIRRMGKEPVYALLLLAGMFLFLAVSPAAIIMAVPLWAISFVVTWMSADGEARKRLVLSGAAVFVACLAFGWVEYVVGLMLYTSSGFFMDELATSYASSGEFASILYQGHIKDRAFGPMLFGLATLGALFVLKRGDTALRSAALVVLAGQVLHAALFAGFLKLTDGWTGPPAIYSEMMLFALYALFLISFTLRKRVSDTLPFLWITLPLLVFLFPTQKERNLLYSFAMPPAETPLVQFLKQHIAVEDGKNFAGRVATVLPAAEKGQLLYSYQHNIDHHNDHLSSGLWLHNIPTLTEYNQLITPAFYRLTRRFLTLPNDKQNRSWASFSYADTRILRLLGVRYLLTTDAARDDAIKRMEIPVRGVKPLHLFELVEPNVQGISAKRVVTVDSLAAAEEAMESKVFSLDTAVMFTPLEGDLQPVTESHITFKRGAYRIRAKSRGKSLLILPMEYSHCMDMTIFSDNIPTLRRVNIALTGLVFEKEIDMLLSMRVGIFHHPRCRMKDYREFRSYL